jgi:hypothetical protein
MPFQKSLIHFIMGCVLLFVLYNLISCATSNQNQSRHLTDEHYYAHFSRIDSSNYLFYPSLLFTSPLHITLYEGDSLLIPAKWWHWIRSSKSIAVNYWILRGDNRTNAEERLIDTKQPCVLNLNLNYDRFLKALADYNEKIDIWDQSTEKVTDGESNLSTFVGDEKDQQYIITVAGYSDSKLNDTLLNHVHRHITVPPHLSHCKIDKNVWISPGNTDTGLHYDDFTGILTVVKGTKEITLFPPEDTSYLDPFDLKPKWAISDPIKFQANIYNFVQELDVSNNLPSSRLLYESIITIAFQNKKLLQIITEVVRAVGRNRTVWGLKHHNGKFRWELYFYHYDSHNRAIGSNLKNVCFSTIPTFLKYQESLNENQNKMIIHSFDLFDFSDCADISNFSNFSDHHDNGNNIIDHRTDLTGILGDDIHLYYRNGNMSFPFFGNGTTLSVSGVKQESTSVIDSQQSFIANYSTLTETIGLVNIPYFKKHLSTYQCKDICIFNKFDGNIFIMYFGISIDDFILFLKRFNYPQQFVQHVDVNRNMYENIEHEIAIVYNIASQIPVRSAFYGIV